MPDHDVSSRAILVGDDATRLAEASDRHEGSVVGVVGPSDVFEQSRNTDAPVATDGGELAAETDHLGDLDGLSSALSNETFDEVVLAFSESFDTGLFDALGTCADRDITTRVHGAHADDVLVDPETTRPELPRVDLNPWPAHQRVLKRLFDVVFAGTVLALFAPVGLLVAVAIKLDSPGPVFFVQDRTKRFGKPFPFRKFRSMVENAEEQTGVVVSAEDAGGVDPRITRVGKVLRATHVDEVPQLLSVLAGDMSVVGPRPAQHELESQFVQDAPGWQQRWFVKPGLTGLAQLNGATGHEPDEKLRHDLEYVRRQSFWVDIRLVARQLYEVAVSVVSLFTRRA